MHFLPTACNCDYTQALKIMFTNIYAFLLFNCAYLALSVHTCIQNDFTVFKNFEDIIYKKRKKKLQNFCNYRKCTSHAISMHNVFRRKTLHRCLG